MSDWQTLSDRFLTARDKVAAHILTWPDFDVLPPIEWQNALEPLADALAEAKEALLLTPAPSLVALAEKLDIMAEQQIADGWYKAVEAIDLAANDAARLVHGGAA